MEEIFKTKHNNYNIIIIKTEYNNGGVAIMAFTEEGEAYSDVSTYIEPLENSNEFFVKDGEVEKHFAQELIKAGLIESTEETGKSGFNTYTKFILK